MRTQSRDTSPEAERVLIDLIRKASVAKRFGLVRSMTATLAKANIKNIRRLHPQAEWAEIVQILTSCSIQLNPLSLTKVLETRLQTRNDEPTFEPDIRSTLTSIIEILASLNVSYYIGGSLATSIYGMQQLAQDIDIVVELETTQFPKFIAQLQADYYFNEQEIRAALQKHTNFSIMHLNTLLKVDIIIPELSPFERLARSRLKWYVLDEKLHAFPLSSPEDIILVKLVHHRKSGVFPDDQWNDILGVLKIQGSDLDLVYLAKWATYLNVTALLQQVCIDAGLRE